MKPKPGEPAPIVIHDKRGRPMLYTAGGQFVRAVPKYRNKKARLKARAMGSLGTKPGAPRAPWVKP